MGLNLINREWARRAAELLLLPIFMGTFATPIAAQRDNNGYAKAAAAEVGQKVPGPSSGSDKAQPNGNQPAIVEDTMAARAEIAQRKLRFEAMKKQAGELTDLARSLQADLDKSNQNVLSVEITEKAKHIEKLAGKIRSESRF